MYSVRAAAGDLERSTGNAVEQIRGQYGNMPGVLLGSAIFTTFLAVTLGEQLASYAVAGWLVVACGNGCMRYVLWRGFAHARPALEELPRWQRRFTVSAGIAGIIWGAGGVLLHLPGSFTEQILVLLVMVCMALMSMLIAASSLAAFIAFTYPVLLLSAVPYFLAGDPVSLGIGAAILLLLPVMTRFAFGLRRESRGLLEVPLRDAKLLAQLSAQKKAAEEASLAKSRFLAIASHDLRQPLHALSLFVLSLQESALQGPERALVANIRRSVDVLEELFDALLDISRLDAGAVHARVETFPLEDLFERLRFEFGAVAQQKGLRFTTSKTSLHARSDPDLLAQILRNLLANALRYTDRGGVLLGCRRRGEKIRIEVWDTGCGIPEDQRAFVFQEFTQLGNPERDRRKGLGLGLAIVERLVRLLGHQIQLTSMPGRGTVFGVTLARGRPEDHRLDVQQEGSLHGAFDLSGILALVIDDDLAVRQGMESLLRRWRCEVIAAASGGEVVEELARVRRTPDLIIADYRQREEANGVALIERLRGEFNTEVPALLFTAGTAAERRDCEASGVPVLTKPVNAARLRTMLAHIASTSAARARRAI
jgi:signal transduction histidine kinase/CheY-like chemotaxis protein